MFLTPIPRSVESRSIPHRSLGWRAKHASLAGNWHNSACAFIYCDVLGTGKIIFQRNYYVNSLSIGFLARPFSCFPHTSSHNLVLLLVCASGFIAGPRLLHSSSLSSWSGWRIVSFSVYSRLRGIETRWRIGQTPAGCYSRLAGCLVQLWKWKVIPSPYFWRAVYTWTTSPCFVVDTNLEDMLEKDSWVKSFL